MKTISLPINVFIFFILIISTNTSLYSGIATPERIELIGMWIQQEPEKIDHYIKRASLFIEVKLYKECLEDLKTAVKIDPKNGLIYYTWANLELALKKEDDALKKLEQCMELMPNYAHAHLLAAQIQFKMGRHEACIENYNTALKHLKHTSPDSFYERCDAHLALGQNKAALQGIDEGIKKLGPIIVFLQKKVEIYKKMKDFKSALQLIDEILKKMNRKETWLSRKAEVYAMAGNQKKSQEYYRLALSEINSLKPRFQNSPIMKKLKAEIEAKLSYQKGSPIK